ncbi:MAG: EAL domain-containing protein [Wenzhouxiangellaceae bacterium]|nr:EAL domain-containing protein [Wenzhouxiangellaceae bacterium]
MAIHSPASAHPELTEPEAPDAHALSRSFRRLFLFVAVFATLALGVLLWLQWQAVVANNEMRQKGLVTLMMDGANTFLRGQTSLLEQLGEQLLDASGSIDAARATRLLDQARDRNPAVVGYGLAAPDGRLLFVNSGFNFPASGSINLLDLPRVREDFQRSLVSAEMVVGAPYFFEPLGQRVVPIRKAIRDDDGVVLGVMTAGLKLSGRGTFLGGNLLHRPGSTMHLVRGFDYWPIYRSGLFPAPPDYFEAPVEAATMNQVLGSLAEHSGMALDAIRRRAEPASYRLRNQRGVQFGMGLYDPEFDLWASEQIDRSEVLATYAASVWPYPLIYLGALALLYWAMTLIRRAEDGRRAELRDRAEHDVLTGLANRARLAADFQRMQQMHAGRLALLFIDLDQFKAVNDIHGHDSGDRLLVAVAEALREHAIDHGCVARVGGDEFVLLIAETARAALREQALAISASVRRAGLAGQPGHEIASGIGIAVAPDDGRTLDELLRAADSALREARSQRNAIRFHDHGVRRRQLSNLTHEQRLRQAIEQRTLRLQAQPQVDAARQLSGFEMLARWHDEQLGSVPPERFIAVAESRGLIVPLGELIIDQWLDVARMLDARVHRPLWLAVNISPLQFRERVFIDKLLARVERAGLSQVIPVLEITESLFMKNDDALLQDARRLREAGVQIALDDFGTGFSSFGRLQYLELDEIKIDRSFVERLDEDPFARTLIESVIAIAGLKQARVVAEGVQTAAQMDRLVAIGCDFFQGHLFADSLPLDQLDTWLLDAGKVSA